MGGDGHASALPSSRRADERERPGSYFRKAGLVPVDASRLLMKTSREERHGTGSQAETRGC